MWPQVAVRMGIRELRDTLTATLRRVQGGETIEITNHQRPVAILVPVPSDRLQQLIDSGEVTRPTKPLFPLPQRVPITTGVSASEALQQDRAERWD